MRLDVGAVKSFCKKHQGILAILFIIGVAFYSSHSQEVQTNELRATVHRLSIIEKKVKPFEPFYHIEPIKIPNRIPGVDGPAVALGWPLFMDGNFCNHGDEKIKALASLSWVAAGADGKELWGQAQTVYSGIPRTRVHGCTSTAGVPFTMPVTVQQIENSLTENKTAHVWHLTGSVTPLQPNGTLGTADRFVTESFQIVHPAP